MNLADLTDADLLARWYAQEPTDSDTSPEQDAITDEIERQGLDL